MLCPTNMGSMGWQVSTELRKLLALVAMDWMSTKQEGRKTNIRKRRVVKVSTRVLGQAKTLEEVTSASTRASTKVARGGEQGQG